MAVAGTPDFEQSMVCKLSNNSHAFLMSPYEINPSQDASYSQGSPCHFAPCVVMEVLRGTEVYP